MNGPWPFPGRPVRSAATRPPSPPGPGTTSRGARAARPPAGLAVAPAAAARPVPVRTATGPDEVSPADRALVRQAHELQVPAAPLRRYAAAPPGGGTSMPYDRLAYRACGAGARWPGGRPRLRGAGPAPASAAGRGG